MNTASLELCKELYELSQWEDTPQKWIVYAEPTPDNEQLEPEVVSSLISSVYKNEQYPAYDLGYLLRKLPYKVKDEYQFNQYGVNLKATASGGWYVCYGEPGKDSEMYFNSADTPENATARLCIELIEQGILPGKEV